MRRKGRTAALLTVFAMAVMTAASGCGGGTRGEDVGRRAVSVAAEEKRREAVFF